MRLIGWELRKILKRGITKVTMAIAFFWILVNMVLMGFSNYGFGVGVTAPSWQANQLIAESYQWAEPWCGPATTEKLLAAREIALDTKDAYTTQEVVSDENGSGAWSLLESFAHILIYTNYADGFTFCSDIDRIPEEAFLQVYSLREELVQQKLSLYPEPERRYLQALEAQVKTPFVYDWYQGHWHVLDFLDDTMFLVGVLICIALVPVFTVEVRTGSYRVTHCTRKGRWGLSSAKVAAALLFAGVAFLAAMGLIFGIQVFYFGTRGLDCSLQLVMYQSVLPLTLGQVEAGLIVFGLISCLAAAAVTIWLSALFDSSFPVGILVLFFLVILRAVAMRVGSEGVLGLFAQAVPFQSQISEFGTVRAVSIGGRMMWRPLVRVLFNVGEVALLCPLAAWRYATRRIV